MDDVFFLSIPSMNQEVWDQYVKNFNLRDLSAESNNQSEICVNVDASNSVSTTMVDPSTSNTIFDDFCSMKDKDFQHPQDCMVGNLSSSQDGQSQITSASLAESHTFSLRDNSGGTSSSHVDFDESSFLQNNNSWKQVAAPIRTYTKVTLFL
jgi:auxin response factor